MYTWIWRQWYFNSRRGTFRCNKVGFRRRRYVIPWHSLLQKDFCHGGGCRFSPRSLNAQFHSILRHGSFFQRNEKSCFPENLTRETTKGGHLFYSRRTFACSTPRAMSYLQLTSLPWDFSFYSPRFFFHVSLYTVDLAVVSLTCCVRNNVCIPFTSFNN